MVPSDQAEIPAAALRALERLLERLARDRRSLEQSEHPHAPAGLERLNALAREADEVCKAFARIAGRPE